MHLGLRLLAGFFLIAGLAAVVILRVVLAEVQPSVSQVIEDMLVDTANLVAEQAAPDLRDMPPGGTLVGSRFATAVQQYLARPVHAQISGLDKRTLDLRIYVTDLQGRVVFDTGLPSAVGSDFARWRDVALTLRGRYGARTSRTVDLDATSTAMVVAAPVRAAPDGPVIGVVAVAKPLTTVQQFIDRAERKITWSAVWLLVASLVLGLAITAWLVHAVRRLRRYALAAAAGRPAPLPALPGELGELAQAMGTMREQLDGRAQIEQGMRALTHELKSPLTAIAGAGELLADDLPADDRQRFAQQIEQQVQRLRSLVDRLLELSRLETLQAPAQRQAVDLQALVQQQWDALGAATTQRRLRLHWLHNEPVVVQGDAEALGLAVSNLLRNAWAFAPEGSAIECSTRQAQHMAWLELRDHGPGVPDWARPRLGERFFSTPAPGADSKGSGLGLAIVQQVALLHGGTLQFDNAEPGLRVRLGLPLGTPPRGGSPQG
jgi:two-component system sensor histidine kinase CreC